MVACRIDSDPISTEIGNLGSKVKGTLTWNVTKIDENPLNVVVYKHVYGSYAYI